MWHCPFKFPFDYYHLLGDNDKFIKSSYVKKDLQDMLDEGVGTHIESKKYSGCPSFSFDKSVDLI